MIPKVYDPDKVSSKFRLIVLDMFSNLLSRGANIQLGEICVAIEHFSSDVIIHIEGDSDISISKFSLSKMLFNDCGEDSEISDSISSIINKAGTVVSRLTIAHTTATEIEKTKLTSFRLAVEDNLNLLKMAMNPPKGYEKAYFEPKWYADNLDSKVQGAEKFLDDFYDDFDDYGYRGGIWNGYCG